MTYKEGDLIILKKDLKFLLSHGNYFHPRKEYGEIMTVKSTKGYGYKTYESHGEIYSDEDVDIPSTNKMNKLRKMLNLDNKKESTNE